MDSNTIILIILIIALFVGGVIAGVGYKKESIPLMMFGGIVMIVSTGMGIWKFVQLLSN